MCRTSKDNPPKSTGELDEVNGLLPETLLAVTRYCKINVNCSAKLLRAEFY